MAYVSLKLSFVSREQNAQNTKKIGPNSEEPRRRTFKKEKTESELSHHSTLASKNRMCLFDNNPPQNWPCPLVSISAK